ncbi:hypothetical protein [Streptomyces sodiiphilus]|uniref:hypothetical protein n=1 Tax=Streptomyces sodiiphilus TaxID=226217 RepID=UPI0031CDE3CE
MSSLHVSAAPILTKMSPHVTDILQSKEPHTKSSTPVVSYWHLTARTNPTKTHAHDLYSELEGNSLSGTVREFVKLAVETSIKTTAAADSNQIHADNATRAGQQPVQHLYLSAP